MNDSENIIFKPNFKDRIMASDKKMQTGPRCFLLHQWMFYYIKQQLKMTDLVKTNPHLFF